jgi:plastocyanin
MADRSKARHLMPFHFVIAALLVVAAAVAQADATYVPSSEPEPSEVKIVSTEFKFMPAKVRVIAGRAVTLILDNSGGETEHGLFLPAFNFRLQAKAGEVARQSFVFEKPGEYDFVCDLPGHREAGMKGTLTVGAF